MTMNNTAGTPAKEKLNILWLYPDVLDLHGGRGDLMGLAHAAELLGLEPEIKRVDGFNDEPDFDWADIIWLAPGEVRCAGIVADKLRPRLDALQAALSRGALLAAIDSIDANIFLVFQV